MRGILNHRGGGVGKDSLQVKTIKWVGYLHILYLKNRLSPYYLKLLYCISNSGVYINLSTVMKQHFKIKKKKIDLFSEPKNFMYPS